MKLLTQFSIPNPSKADLAKTNNRRTKTLEKVVKNNLFVFLEAFVNPLSLRLMHN